MNKYLLIVLFTAAIVRLWGLGSNPPSLYWDEVALGYDAYSLWNTGKDHHGNPWPIIAFESYGDFKPSGYFYAAAPFVGMFGLEAWTVRLPSAIAGIVAVYLVYVIGAELFKKKEVGLVSAFCLAILPWHLHISRVGFEVNLATTFLLSGILCMLKSRRKPIFLLFSTICFVLSTYTYHGLRLLAPLIALLSFLIFARHLIKTRWFIISASTALLLMLPILINISNPVVSKRFAETSFFSESKAVETANRHREGAGNTLVSRIIYHRYWFWGAEIASSMMKHFSLNFLFVHGDGNGRHQNISTGLMYWWMVIPLFFSLYGLRHKHASLFFLMLWILLASIPPALSLPSPHSLRYLPAAPAFALLIGYGLCQLMLIKHRYRNLFIASFLLVMLFESSRYADDYITNYPQRYSQAWQYGYHQLFSYLATQVQPDEKVYITREYGRPSMYYFFYNKVDPKQLQQFSPSAKKDQSELLEYGNYQFGAFPSQVSGWLVTTSPIESKNLQSIIFDLEDKPVFYIYR